MALLEALQKLQRPKAEEMAEAHRGRFFHDLVPLRARTEREDGKWAELWETRQRGGLRVFWEL